MGGFAAILTRSDPAIAARLPAMLDAAPHRGASAGSLASGRVALAGLHTAGLDDLALARDGGWIAVFSGCLDNFAELARSSRGWAGDGAPPDPAALALRLVRDGGAGGLGRMRGVFAGAVGDGERLWVFRDHLGLKPAFFHDGPGGYVAASEPKQVVAGAGISRRPDMDALEQIFYGRTSDRTPSALAGVSRLPKGTCGIATAAGAGIQRYWHPERLLETASLTPGEVDERWSELFAQAVARSLGPRTTISLSGGIDSPAVAAFAARAPRPSPEPLGALSAVFPDLPAVDESSYIELAAARFGLDLHTYRPSARALDDAVSWSALTDGPVPTVSVPELHENYELARRLGYDTILTGELAEFVIDQRRHLLGHLAIHGRARPLAAMVRLHRRRGVGWGVIGRQLALPFVPGRLAVAYASRRGANARPPVPDWLDPRMTDDASYHADLRVAGRRRWLEQQLLAFPGPGITIEADEVCQALNGVVVRRPFADVDLWEFFLSLPAELKFPDASSKTLVRRNLRGLVPDEILDRRDKTAFNDHMLASADWAAYERLLVDPRHRLRGIDYAVLGERIRARRFTFYDHFWARDLAAVHAFLEAW